MTRNAPLVPIEDPYFYLNDPWPTFAWMRAKEPFYYYEPLDTYVVTRHADIRAIAARSDVFISSRGLFLNDVKYQGQTGSETLTDSFFPKGGEQVGTADRPRHTELRRVIGPAFSSAALGRMREPLTRYVEEVVDTIVPGEPVDWVDHASTIPIGASIELIGLQHARFEQVMFWSGELEKLGSDLSFDELRAAAREFQSLQEFIISSIEAKREAPGEDLLNVLLDAELDNDKVSQANVVMFAMTMLAAGSDTTRSLLSGLVYHLARHPEQWELLRRDRTLIPLAVEETLRYVSPARAFLRTAARDTEVNGQEIRAGQHVYLLYMAANRDETVFPAADRYDVTRKESSKHLAFGDGPHVCAGSRLVRIEAPIMLNALLDRFSAVELAGKATPVVHVIRNGWSAMPVVFAR